MFMKIHGDDPKESNGLYKSGSAAMPVALECDEWIECLQFNWKFSWELKTIYCWWFSWGCCREFSPLCFKGDWNGERVVPGIETLGKTLVFGTTTVLQDDEKEILVSELKLPFVLLQKPCFFNACSRVYNDSCKVLIVLVHFVCSVIAGLLR